MKRYSRLFSCLVALSILLGTLGYAGGLNAPAEDTMVSMRDGINLATTVYFPTQADSAEGPWPVIVLRSPYNKDGIKGQAEMFGKHGYVTVAQDCRGRFKSEGENKPFLSDIEDGYDTLEWIAAQEWCDGNIGITGGSALGITSNLAAVSGHPALKAAFVIVAPASWRNESVRINGIYKERMIDGWMGAQGATALRKEWTHLPLDATEFDFMDMERHHSLIQIPIYNVGGWFDIFLKGSIENFVGVQARGAGKARGNQKLLMAAAGHGPISAPWKEYPNEGGHIGKADPVAWFDYWLKGVDNGIMDEPAVRYFLMGDAQREDSVANVWLEAEIWPPASTPTDFFLTKGGALSSAAPTHNDSAIEYDFDPKNPVPTFGGSNLILPKGPMDQAQIKDRTDYFRFNTEPLDAPVAVVGQVIADLWVDTDAPDTDFMVKLVDVYPDGYEALILDNGLQMRYRNGLGDEVFMEPGQVERAEIDLWSTAYVFEVGHRIGVHITSSNHPRFAVNPNTGDPLRANDQTRVAHNRVHLSADHPSRIILPVVELDALKGK